MCVCEEARLRCHLGMPATISFQAVALKVTPLILPLRWGLESDRFKLTQEGAADVLGDLVAGLGLGEVAELLVEHALELERRDESVKSEKSFRC